MTNQGVPVGDNHCFHACSHEQHLIVGRIARSVPLAAPVQVVPSQCKILQRVLTVDPHRHVFEGGHPLQCGFEVVEGGAAGTAGNQSRHPTRYPAFSSSFRKLSRQLICGPFESRPVAPPSRDRVALTSGSLRCDLASTFRRVDIVPIQPIRQLRFVEAAHPSLAIVLFADHHEVRALRHRIDQDVRMRGDDELCALGCLRQQVCQLRKDVGMQSQFRLLDANEGRG